EQVGRDVALKVMRPEAAERPEERGRFLREARIQARLEHPALVPVYDMGEHEAEDDDGESARAWFTMRRVRGETLADIFERLASGDSTARYRRNKLLQIFVQICRALDYAHDRGVVHRDVTPANVMVGRFGEVYLLDWGIAKLTGDAVDGRPTSSDVPDDELEVTEAGSSLGTPGYMSPEQALGDTETGPTADVYSLGCILFELLTLERANPAQETRKRISKTIEGIDARPSVRFPDLDVPPELEELCVRATHVDPEQRLQSAGELANGIESFLEGDRDHELRRKLAREHVKRAVALVDEGDEKRPEATRELARALALDPQSRPATELLAQLLVDPPKQLPEGAKVALAEWLERARRRAAKVSAWRYGLWLAFLPVYLAMGVRIGWLFATCSTLLVGCFGLAILHARGSVRGAPATTAVYVLSTLSLLFFVPAFSPLLVVPSLMATNLMYFAAHVTPQERGIFVVLTALGTGAVFAGEALGLWPPTFVIDGEGIHIIPRLLELPPALTWGMLAAWAVLTASIPGIQAGRTRDNLVKTEHKLLRYVWQIQQLVPGELHAPPELDTDTGRR
ncbi:MAG TPA: serine/threonine-protein kinase, partial [Polyangiaceae bacterium LLY-WYZ-15_(1-7)]|nr:serine/threonine-protein kinase [Polyangiaceae bacterium LLY-WYZ-15_(1-7)]